MHTINYSICYKNLNKNSALILSLKKKSGISYRLLNKSDTNCKFPNKFLVLI